MAFPDTFSERYQEIIEGTRQSRISGVRGLCAPALTLLYLLGIAWSSAPYRTAAHR